MTLRIILYSGQEHDKACDLEHQKLEIVQLKYVNNWD